MAKYRKLPVVIESFQYNGHNDTELRQWSNNKVIGSPVIETSTDNPTGRYVQIETLEGTMIGIVGDFIIKGVNGEFYPCKQDIFHKTYELINDTEFHCSSNRFKCGTQCDACRKVELTK